MISCETVVDIIPTARSDDRIGWQGPGLAVVPRQLATLNSTFPSSSRNNDTRVLVDCVRNVFQRKATEQSEVDAVFTILQEM